MATVKVYDILMNNGDVLPDRIIQVRDGFDWQDVSEVMMDMSSEDIDSYSYQEIK